MRETEIEGKTVTIAVESGLKELGLRRDQVEVEVLDQGSPGFLGIGAKSARVRIREKIWGEGAKEPQEPKERKAGPTSKPRRDPEPRRSSRGRHSGGRGGDRGPSGRQDRKRDEPRGRRRRSPEKQPRRERPSRPAPVEDVDTGKACETAEAVLKEILDLASLTDAKVTCVWDEEQSRVRAEVETADAGLLIGKAGRTLEALQFLVTVIVGRKTGVPTAIQVESQGYWKKIEEKILSETERAVREVKRTGRSYRFEPMEPALRRLVHRKLVDDPDVETSSEGEGPWRKVVVRPKGRQRAQKA